MGTLLPVGTPVFMASAGVGRISQFAARDSAGKPAPLGAGDEPAFYVVEADEVTACIPISAPERTLRPLMSSSLANQVLGVLRGPFEGTVEATPLLTRGKQVVHGGDPLEQARLLRELYALPIPVNEALGSGLTFVQRLVLAEVAAVTGVDHAALEAEMRALHPAAQDMWDRERMRIRFQPDGG